MAPAPWYAFLPEPLVQFAYTVFGEPCFTDIVGNFNVGNKECLALMVSKTLSLGIIVASSIIKLPQILKIVNAASAQGLSALSNVLELLAYTVTVAYNLRKGYPVLTYGETALLTVQDFIIVLLIFAFGNAGPASRRPLLVLAFPAIYAAIVYALSDASVVAAEHLELLQTATIPVVTASRIPQIYSNYKNGSTGNLSAVAVFAYLLGSCTRIFTTLQEVNDPVILTGFVVGAVANLVLALQMVYYWNAAPARRAAVAASAAAPAAPEGKAASPRAKRTSKVD